MRLSLRSGSTQTLVLLPTAVLVEQLLARRPLRLRWAPLMLAGFVQYRLCGRYRTRRGGGPPGMSQGRPDTLVTTGPYAVTRNPMYLGHLVFLTGLTLATRSPVALALTATRFRSYDERARADQVRLTRLFGAPYMEYAARVPRWLPGLPGG